MQFKTLNVYLLLKWLIKDDDDDDDDDDEDDDDVDDDDDDDDEGKQGNKATKIMKHLGLSAEFNNVSFLADNIYNNPVTNHLC